MKKVATVVVTYNRLSLLQRLVAALLNQTRKPDAIVIVNNDSTDGTTEWLKTQQELTTIHQPNEGGAAGFYTGMKYAAESGFDYAWVMDDDGLPEPDCLEKLVSSEALKQSPETVVSSLVLVPGSKSELPFHIPIMNSYNKMLDHYMKRSNQVSMVKAQATPLGYEWSIFFNSNLIPTSIIKKIGLPRKDFFIWGDEAEYFARIKKNKYPMYMVIDSVFYHPAGNASIWSRSGNIPRWKEKYLVRNHTYIHKKYKPLAWLHHIYMLLRILQCRKFYLLKPLYHGLTGKFSGSYITDKK
jgi:Predicted glycosyltransferases